MQYHSHCFILNIITTDRLIALWLDLRVANLYTAGRASSLWHWEGSQCQRLAAGILPRPSMALWQRKPRNFNFGENPFLHTRWGLILIIETAMSPGFERRWLTSGLPTLKWQLAKLQIQQYDKKECKGISHLFVHGNPPSTHNQACNRPNSKYSAD